MHWKKRQKEIQHLQVKHGNEAPEKAQQQQLARASKSRNRADEAGLKGPRKRL